ncbi:hypothetical protein ACKWTF_016695 [Chironomus riparius]
MVLVTLSGSMIAIDPQTANLRWFQQHGPVIKSTNNEKLNFSSILLPNPVSGQLYSLKTTINEEFELSRLDHTIPDLVLKSPFISKDKILYTGRKADSWFIINSLTGECKTVMDFSESEDKTTDLIPSKSIYDVYIGRTQYDVCMTNMQESNNTRDHWNVSMYQYNAFEMNSELYDKYEFVHIVSSSSGKLLTLLKNSGEMLWHKSDLNSPIVALFLMGKNGFLNIPFTTVDDGVFDKLMEPLAHEKFRDFKLFETVYVGENKSAGANIFYALPSYTDNTTYIIRQNVENFFKDPTSILGHHQLYSENDASKVPLLEDKKEEVIISGNKDKEVLEKDERENLSFIYSVMFMITLGGLTVIISFIYKRKLVREFSKSSSNSRKKDNKEDEKFVTPTIGDDGKVTITKISFDPTTPIGKGCEGTFVYKGKFEGRNVAVKRLLIDCFTLADREVKALRDSDNHENIIRYFCTEYDRQFCYIAVELCSCSLNDYIMDKKYKYLRATIKPKEVLYQATKGLSHLHNLNIIHRDIKPQNILITLPDVRNDVRAMISDFGLSKRIDNGVVSATNRAGVAGTDGWIAPELLKDDKLTKAADIFSLGCVFFFTFSNGKHPFGDSYNRQANVIANKFDLSILSDNDYSNIFAKELITDMINANPQDRPISDAILRHPIFWGEGKLLDFLQTVSDRIEKLHIRDEPLWTLERNARMVVKDDWKQVIEEEILNDLGKQRTYQGISVRDLMRAMRNKVS